jgi:hypothetical protein
MRIPVTVLAVPLAFAAIAATAEEVNEPVGTRTQAWVQLQTSGTAASPVERTTPGDIADKTYDRYANSFTHPIPEKFEREKFTESGGGSK